MRALHLGVGNLFGGIESLLLTLARQRHLCPEVEPSFTVCFEGRLSEELRACGVPVHRLGATRYSRPWTVWASRWRLARLLKRERFDVVVDHGCWTRGLYGRLIRRRGLPSAFWLHGPADGRHRLERRARRHPPNVVIANSRFTASSADRLFPGVPVEVIHPPVASPPPPTRTREELRGELKTDADSFVILTACRLEEWKGHRSLVAALAELRDAAGWVAWVAGGAQRDSERSYLDELRAEAARRGIADRLRWLGQRRDVPDLLAAADLYCQPNEGPEPFGISFVEALHAGLPVVTTALGGAVEIVDASSGTLVPPGRIDLLSAAIRGYLKGHSGATRSERAARAMVLCDPETLLKKLADTLRSATGNSPAKLGTEVSALA